MIRNVVVTYHYGIDDEDCNGDFYEADLSINGCQVLKLTDQYHDKPREQFEGFLKGLDWAGIKYNYEEQKINDSTY